MRLLCSTISLSRLLPVLLVGGCSFWSNDAYEIDAPSVETTLRELPAVSEPAPLPLDNVSLAELVEQLESLQTAESEVEVSNRLAQLRLRLMEEQLLEGEADFAAPIAALTELRSVTVDENSKASIDYQLARVRALSGQNAEVLAALSDTIASGESAAMQLEARFRRAEIYFSLSENEAAEADFSVVAGQPGELKIHSLYMLAWVRFKLSRLDESLAASTAALTELAGGEQRRYNDLKTDLLRVTVLALEYLDGPETLAVLMRKEKPDYQTEVYRALGDWYLSKQRFADSALTWQTFLAENPLHPDAPGIALEVIGTQREAGFVGDIPELEKQFILGYGKQTEFFSVNGDAVFTSYQKPLREMLDRYVQRLHAGAQDSEIEGGYLPVAEAYEVWLANFSDTEGAQEKRFLYAETLELARGFLAAKAQFERVLAMDANTSFAREAAYALVLGVNKHIDELGIGAAIDVNLQFAQQFPEDERAPASQVNAVTQLFDQGDYLAAKTEAATAMAMGLSRQAELIPRRVIAHSAFELNQFAEAEAAYRELIDVGEDFKEQLLASVFKQGEIAEQQGDLASAVYHYGRIESIAPKSDLARNAMYDIATLYEQMGQTDQAITQLEQFRARYPAQAKTLGHDFILRLVAMRESQGDLIGAANELAALSKKSSGEAGRVARFRAAELYLEAGQLNEAIEHFRFYAHNFLQPASVRLEAMHHMDELYQTTNAPAKRQFWLRQKRDLVKTLGQAERTERARYLAANAIFELSEADYVAFRDTKLTLPLNRSLSRKQKRLQSSLANYQAVIDLGVFEYTALSYLRMARQFEHLAKDLIQAERPKGLNELETEQYVLLLEEQAFPFEEKAIQLHEKNLQLGWQSGWNQAVQNSLIALQNLSPAKFRRPELEVAYVAGAE